VWFPQFHCSCFSCSVLANSQAHRFIYVQFSLTDSLAFCLFVFGSCELLISCFVHVQLLLTVSLWFLIGSCNSESQFLYMCSAPVKCQLQSSFISTPPEWTGSLTYLVVLGCYECFSQFLSSYSAHVSVFVFSYCKLLFSHFSYFCLILWTISPTDPLFVFGLSKCHLMLSLCSALVNCQFHSYSIHNQLL
jgi:hypothetical protein